MMQRMETYALERAAIRKNELQENIKEWRSAGEIQVAISTATGAVQEINQIQRISSTHTAITPRRDVYSGDRFGGYSVDYVIPGRRYNQLFLTREEALHADQL